MQRFVTGTIEDYKRLTGQTSAREGQTVKYGNHKTMYNGKLYDSKAEVGRLEELEWLEKCNKIHSLETQKVFYVIDAFDYHGRHIKGNYCKYDFYYFDIQKDTWVSEDKKSEATRKKEAYIIKSKLFMQRYPHILFLES